MAITAWHASKAEVADALNQASRDAIDSRARVREVLRRFAAWARTENGPKPVRSQAGRLVPATIDKDTVIPLGDKDGDRVDHAMAALYIRSPGQYEAIRCHVINGHKLEAVAGYYRMPQSKVREMVNAGLDYLDGAIGDIV